jgi:hypothetical protein
LARWIRLTTDAYPLGSIPYIYRSNRPERLVKQRPLLEILAVERKRQQGCIDLEISQPLHQVLGLIFVDNQLQSRVVPPDQRNQPGQKIRVPASV